jgi:hypothetical protein
MSRETRRLLFWALLLGLTASAGLAQQITGTILGTVKDVSGAVVSAAVVTVTNEDTNIAFRAATEASGDYVASNLLPGSYTVTTEVAGFKKNTVKGARLLANRTVRVDLVLEPGTVVETIEVRAPSPVVNSENSTVGSIMEAPTIAALPLNGRTIDRLLSLAAGTVDTGGGRTPRFGGAARRSGVQFNVDGVNFNDAGNGSAYYAYTPGAALTDFPSLDAISEFKVDANNQKAEFEASASVTIVGKSGTNQFHGSAFEYNRNRAFAARVPYVPPTWVKPPFNRNEFGASLGGPIRRDRTFIFGYYEGLRQRTPATNQLSVATAAMRNGDFAGLPVIIDPLSGSPFPNNRVPAERIDPRSKTLIGYVPPPNLPGIGPAGTLNNYIVNVPQFSDVNRLGIRPDHRFSGKDSLWGNFNHSKNTILSTGSFPTNYGHKNVSTRTDSLNVTHVHTFSPRTLNEARFGWVNHGYLGFGMNADFDPRSLFPGLYGPQTTGGLPNVQINNHVTIGDRGGTLIWSRQLTTQYIDNLTHVHGRHTFKTGVDIDHFSIWSPPQVYGQGEGEAQDAGLGRFAFNGRFSNSSTSAAQPAHAFADFLMGYPNVAYRATQGADVTPRKTRYSAYIQDDWQASRRLTLNVGLRTTSQTPWKEKDGIQANFDFASGKLVVPGNKFPAHTQARMVAAYPIVTSAQAGLPDELLEGQGWKFAPRLGFAYRPFANNKTVVRGGAGLYYNFLQLFSGFNQLSTSNAPFVLSETFESDPGRVPSLTLAQPFPGSGAILANPAINAVERNIKDALSQQWSLSLERELVGTLGVRASYVGNKTNHVLYAGRQINVSERQIAGAIQPNRPYQPWSDISLLDSGGDSTLHQLQLEALQRASRGFSFQAEYSWNRLLDNTPTSGGPQNPYNNRGERGNSDGIQRHIFTGAYSYELPFGPGKPMANVSGGLGKLIGGWQVGGITILRTGTPFGVSFSATQPGWRGGRADLVRDPKLPQSERSRDRWFDPSAYAVPAPFTYGNSARNMLFGPGAMEFDVSLLKNTAIRERWSLQLRAEFFNLANHANLGNPSTNISVPATVGKITGASGSRQIQFAAKVLF